MQYYYLGNLEKSKYYNDRHMRGMIEKPSSKIRSLYDGFSISRKEKDSKRDKISFKRLKEILESFANI